MKRIIFLLSVVVVMVATLYTGVAWAAPTNCVANSLSSGGTAESGQTGDWSRFVAEATNKHFGHDRIASDAQQKEGECDIVNSGGSDAPGAFDPKRTP